MFLMQCSPDRRYTSSSHLPSPGPDFPFFVCRWACLKKSTTSLNGLPAAFDELTYACKIAASMFTNGPGIIFKNRFRFLQMGPKISVKCLSDIYEWAR